MRRVAALVAGLAMVVPSAMLGQGANPLDDDAGSGADAGDVPDLAVPVTPGKYQGRLGEPHDTTDYYSFEGRRGDWIHIGLRAPRLAALMLYAPGSPGIAWSGLPYGGTHSGYEATELLTEDGTWYLAVQLYSSAVPAPLVEYDFSFRFSKPAQFLILDSSDAWQATEIVLSGPTRYVQSARVSVGPSLGTAPVAGFFVEQADLTIQGRHFRDAGYGYFGGSAYGEGVSVDPVGIHHPLALPGVEPPVRATGDGGLWTRLDLLTHNVTAEGGVRLASVRSPDAALVITFSADRPFDVRLASGNGGVVWWRDFDSGADVGLAVPGASVVGPRSLEMHARGLTIGAFSPWLFEGAVEGGAAGPVALDFLDFAFLLGLPEGRWEFRLGATAGVGSMAAFPYLLAAEIPSLGLLPDWRDGVDVARSLELKELLESLLG